MLVACYSTIEKQIRRVKKLRERERYDLQSRTDADKSLFETDWFC